MSIGRGEPKKGLARGGTGDGAEVESSVEARSSQPFPRGVSALCRPLNNLGFSRISSRGPLKLSVWMRMEAC